MSNKYETGSMFAPMTFLERKVQPYAVAYYTKKYVKFKPKKLYEHVHTFIRGCAAVSYLQYLQSGRLMRGGEVMIPREVLKDSIGWVFSYDFCKIADLMRKDYKGKDPILSFRRSPQGVTHGYGVNFPNTVSMDKLDGAVGDLCEKCVSCFYDYIKEHSKSTLDPEYKEFAENYYKYEIDMEKADVICKERNGVSFSEANEYLKSVSSISFYDKMFLKSREAEKEYFMCKSFNSSSYNIKQVYGRVYTPFHSIAKAYRTAFRTRKTKEAVVEAVDMKGAFIKGSLAVVGCVSTEFGNKSVSDKVVDILSNMDDPYSFAVDSKHLRKDVKTDVLSFFFSSFYDISKRNRIYNKLYKNGVLDKVYNHACSFLSVVKENRGVLYMSDSDVNKIFNRFSKDIFVASGFYGYHGTTKMRWTNDKSKKGFFKLRNYIEVMESIKHSVGQHHVIECFSDTFGSEVLDALYFTIKMFDNYTKITLDDIQKGLKNKCNRLGGLPMRRYDIMRGRNYNLSILCQEAEGEMMFKDALPLIKKETGCTKLITLHDAVFCPESYKTVVQNTIGDKLDSMYYNRIMKIYLENPVVRQAVKYWK